VSPLIVLVLVALALWWGLGRTGSLPKRKRTPNSHLNTDGRPKRGYATKEEALMQAARLHDKDGARMNVYKCATCPQWHVGHAK